MIMATILMATVMGFECLLYYCVSSPMMGLVFYVLFLILTVIPVTMHEANFTNKETEAQSDQAIWSRSQS